MKIYDDDQQFVLVPITREEFNRIMPHALAAKWFEIVEVTDNGNKVKVTWINIPIIDAMKPLAVFVKTIAAPFVFTVAFFQGNIYDTLEEYKSMYQKTAKKKFTRILSDVDATMIRNFMKAKT